MLGCWVVVASGVVAAGFGGPLRFEPPDPRMGDLVVVYANLEDPEIREGTLEVFGYETVFHRVSSHSLRAFAAVPVDLEPGVYLLRAYLGEDVQSTGVQVFERDFETTELSVSSRFTGRKSRRLRRRLRREKRTIQALWEAPPTAPLSGGPFLWPVETEVTGVFGTRRIFNGTTKSRHYGLDLDGTVGDPVHAVLTGRVVMSTYRFYSGGTVVLDHGSSLFSLYFHLSRRDVKKGAIVRAGQRVGSVGRTGRVTGPHLHLSIVVRAVYADGELAGKARSMYVDPERALGLVLEADPAMLGLPTPLEGKHREMTARGDKR